MDNTRPILIAGCGYVGSQLARMLESAGQKYTALTYSGKTAGPLTGEILQCDLSSLDEIMEMSQNIPKPSAIVHCASSNRGGSDAYRAVYLNGVKNLVSAFPDQPLFFTSSTSVYAQNDGSLVSEDSPAEPDRETSQILRKAEELVLAKQGTVLRLSGIYGPGRCIYLQRMLDGTATIEAGPTSRYLNQIHRDDAASAIAHLLSLPEDEVKGQIYNVTDGNSPNQRECYESLARFLDRPAPPEAAPAERTKRALTHKRISNEKLCATGWKPIYPSLIDALKTDANLMASFV